MFNVAKTAKGLTAVAVVALSTLVGAASAAEGPSSRVVAPDRTGSDGTAIGACYQVTERLYGPYSMSFCLNGRNSYKVKGGGLSCNGTLSSTISGHTINIRLARSSCGHGRAWSADSMSCSSVGVLGTLPLPGLGDLKCTYTPAVAGFKPVPIRAYRIR